MTVRAIVINLLPFYSEFTGVCAFLRSCKLSICNIQVLVEAMNLGRGSYLGNLCSSRRARPSSVVCALENCVLLICKTFLVCVKRMNWALARTRPQRFISTFILYLYASKRPGSVKQRWYFPWKFINIHACRGSKTNWENPIELKRITFRFSGRPMHYCVHNMISWVSCIT